MAIKLLGNINHATNSKAVKPLLATALDSVRIQRLPFRRHENLKGWDAADELLLNTLAEQHRGILDNTSTPILVVNDTFGALTTSLRQYPVDNWSDSSIAHAAAAINYTDNTGNTATESAAGFTAVPSTQALQNQYAIVLFKIPKTLKLLEQQLIQVRAHIDSHTLFIAAGMTKTIHKSTLALFERLIGDTSTSLAKKKARLIFTSASTRSTNKVGGDTLMSSEYHCDALKISLLNYANSFSREHLDIGARAMIEAIQQAGQNATLPQANAIADLGCGNGVLGLVALKQLTASVAPDTARTRRSIWFIDESYMAIACCEKNFTALNTHQHIDAEVTLLAQDGLTNMANNSLDWIICNPPFHSGTAINTAIANRMFKQSHQCLRRNGQLWVVANRHLNYQQVLQRIFSNHRVIYRNSKFVVISVIKR